VAEDIVVAVVGEMKDEMCIRGASCVSIRGGFGGAWRASEREGGFRGGMGNVGIDGRTGEKPEPVVCEGRLPRFIYEVLFGFKGCGYADGEPRTGRTAPNVGLGWPGGDAVKLGNLGGGTWRIVAPSSRPGILGYVTGERPVVGDRGDSATGDNMDKWLPSASIGASSSNGPAPDDEEVSIVVPESPESFESDRVGPLRPELLLLLAAGAATTGRGPGRTALACEYKLDERDTFTSAGSIFKNAGSGFKTSGYLDADDIAAAIRATSSFFSIGDFVIGVYVSSSAASATCDSSACR
jgi:hypothetical protein